MENETKKQNDQIIGTIIQNVIAESNRADGKIVLWDFQPSNAIDRLYYHVACIVADIYDKQIYLEMGFLEYLRFKKKNKKRKNLHWIWRKWNLIPDEAKTSVYIIMDFVRESYGVDIDIFDKINKEYYENINC